jgi:hypothetical protein
MVHVEIFTGGETGEETLGARFQKGTVQFFPSYKFPSKLWTLKEYFFCSIDTWLDGQCVSCCSEHDWVTSNAALIAAAGSRSIFYDPQEDESAGDFSDIEDDGEGQEGGEGEEAVAAVKAPEISAEPAKAKGAAGENTRG